MWGEVAGSIVQLFQQTCLNWNLESLLLPSLVTLDTWNCLSCCSRFFFFFSNLRIALKCRNFPLSVAHDFWLGAFSCVGFFFFSPSYHIGYWHFSVFRFTFLCDIWIISFSENTELWCHTGMYLIYSLSSPKLCLRALCLKYDSNDTYQFKFPRDSNSKETLYSMKFTKMKMPSLAWYCNWNKRVGR